MASGRYEQKFNSKERALSVDHERTQRLVGFMEAEMLRYMLDVYADEDSGGGVITEPSAIETPLRGEVLNGLLVRPQAGNFDLFVDAGYVALMQPDAGPNESSYKTIREQGLNTSGALTLSSNASGSARVDVIECQMSAALVTTSEARDIFNEANGTFASAGVPKLTRGQLTYRVRAGTPGGGFPGVAAGWLPLAVAYVPSGAANNNACSFWDVRPLVSDRVRTPFMVTSQFAYPDQQHFVINDRDFASELRISGVLQSTLNGRRVGGLMRKTTWGAEASNAYANLLEHQEQGFSIPATGIAYLYLMTPYGLPRWARYTDGPAGRVPRSPGLLVLSNKAPSTVGKAIPGLPPNLPAWLASGVGEVNAVCVAALNINSSAIRGSIGDGKAQWCRVGNGSTIQNDGIAVTATTLAVGTTVFTITPGTHYPANAKALWVELVAGLNYAANTVSSVQNGGVELRAPGSSNPIASLPAAQLSIGGGSSAVSSARYSSGLIRIPLIPDYPGNVNTPQARTVAWRLEYNGTGIASATMYICGWEM